MNHPRRVRRYNRKLRRLLLFIPLALLGAAWLVRARLPRPQTEGDKWLWEQAETTSGLYIGVGDTGTPPKDLKVGFSGMRRLNIQDRQGIRVLLHTFRLIPSFVIDATHGPDTELDPLLGISIEQKDLEVQNILLYGEPGHYYLDTSEGRAPVDDASIERLLQALRTAANKAKQKQHGYSFYFTGP